MLDYIITVVQKYYYPRHALSKPGFPSLQSK